MISPGDVINKIAENERITVSALATSLGKPAANLYDIQSGKIRGISRKLADTINRVYPKYNLTWILTGDGDMFSQKDVSVPKSASNESGVPLFDLDFGCGFMAFYNDETVTPVEYVNFPGTKGATCWCKATGDSMEPLIHSGDYVCLKKVDQWDLYLTMGDVYAVEAVNDLRTIKKIDLGKDSKSFTLVPVNTELYKPQPIQKKAIRQIFKVVAVTKFL